MPTVRINGINVYYEEHGEDGRADGEDPVALPQWRRRR